MKLFLSFRILLRVQYTGCVVSTDPPDQHGVSSWWRPVAVPPDSHRAVTAVELRGMSVWLHVLVSIWNGVHGADNFHSNIRLESKPSLSWDVMQQCYAHCAVSLRSRSDLGLRFLVETLSKCALSTTQLPLWIHFRDHISTKYMSRT